MRALADAVHRSHLVVVGGAVDGGGVGVGRARGGADRHRALVTRARAAVHVVARQLRAAVRGGSAPGQGDLSVAGGRSQAPGSGGGGGAAERARTEVVETTGRAAQADAADPGRGVCRVGDDAEPRPRSFRRCARPRGSSPSPVAGACRRPRAPGSLSAAWRLHRCPLVRDRPRRFRRADSSAACSRRSPAAGLLQSDIQSEPVAVARQARDLRPRLDVRPVLGVVPPRRAGRRQ